MLCFCFCDFKYSLLKFCHLHPLLCPVCKRLRFHLCYIRELKQRRLRTTTATATRAAKKHQVKIGKTTTLYEHRAFLYISLPSLHDYDIKLPNFTFSRRTGSHDNVFLFLFVNLDTLLKNSTLEKIANISQIKRVAIRAMSSSANSLFG